MADAALAHWPWLEMFSTSSGIAANDADRSLVHAMKLMRARG